MEVIMKKRYILKSRTRFFIFIVTALLLSFTFFFCNSVYGYKPPHYKTLCVAPGDTLWTIAEQYRANSDIREYIFEVKKLNNLKDSEIYPEMDLKLPVE